MSFSASHLTLRNGKFHFKMRIPPDFISVFGMETIRKSLRTSDEKEAKRSADVMASRVRSSFDLIRSGVLSEDQTKSLVASFKKIKREKPTPSKKLLFLSDLIKLYTQENSPNWKPKTVDEFKAQFTKIVTVMGDAPAESYDRSKCLECRGGLLAQGLAPKTVNKYLGLLSSLFKWCVRLRYIGANPAEGIMLDIPRRPDKERKAYDTVDLQKIIDKIPLKTDEIWKAWIPIIGMLSGLRREEICQLYPSDIRLVDKVWCFDVNGNADDKSIKTESSDRLVPVHSTLLLLGLIKYVESRKGSHNLWGFSKWKTQWGKQFGNWYSLYFNRKYITDDPLKCFHSFRHYVADHLKQSGFQELLISELLGHSNGNITTGRYGKKFLPPRLVDAVEALGAGLIFRNIDHN